MTKLKRPKLSNVRREWGCHLANITESQLSQWLRKISNKLEKHKKIWIATKSHNFLTKPSKNFIKILFKYRFQLSCIQTDRPKTRDVLGEGNYHLEQFDCTQMHQI